MCTSVQCSRGKILVRYLYQKQSSMDQMRKKLGQLIVTPEVVASKINNMKENKSPGVDGLSPKILKETVEQISKPLAHVFNMSLQEGIVPLEWK